MLAHLETDGLGHVAEVADAEPPHTPGGCPSGKETVHGE
jgi:hypothetical protein